MNRIQILRWLLEKLLGSFLISAIILWGPIFGIEITGYSMGAVYTIITTVSVFVSMIVFILVPFDLKIRKRISIQIEKIVNFLRKKPN
jgi:hypothetical protein